MSITEKRSACCLSRPSLSRDVLPAMVPRRAVGVMADTVGAAVETAAPAKPAKGEAEQKTHTTKQFTADWRTTDLIVSHDVSLGLQTTVHPAATSPTRHAHHGHSPAHAAVVT